MYFSVQNVSYPAGPSPPNYLDKQLSFLPPVLYDGVPVGKSFGDVYTDAKASYTVVCLIQKYFLLVDTMCHGII